MIKKNVMMIRIRNKEIKITGMKGDKIMTTRIRKKNHEDEEKGNDHNIRRKKIRLTEIRRKKNDQKHKKNEIEQTKSSKG